MIRAMGTMTSGDRDLSPFPSKPEDWVDGKVMASLTASYEWTMVVAERIIDWYDRSATRRGAQSRRLRKLTIVFGTLGTLLPLLVLATSGLVRTIPWFDPSQLGYVFLALAAATFAADNAFGYSSSWMRYRLTQYELRRLVSNFRFDWAIELSRLSSKALKSTQIESLLHLQQTFMAAVEATTERETQLWAQEFRSHLVEFAKAYKIQAIDQGPGTLDLVVDNAELAKDVQVVMDGRLVGTLQGKSLFLPNVPSGSHRVEIKGILNNKPAYAEGTVAIIPGQVAPLKLALVPQGPPMTATA